MLAALAAAERVAEAAVILRSAAEMGDPYLRGDRIWEAVEQLRESFREARTEACEKLTEELEEACDGAAPPPFGDDLARHARALDHYVATLRGLAGAAEHAPLEAGTYQPAKAGAS